MTIRRVRKRDGREAPFDASKIEAAVEKAMSAVGESDPAFSREVSEVVRLELESRTASRRDEAKREADAGLEPGRADRSVPGIEEIQDLVERTLVELGRFTVAKAYILYRDRRSRVRGALEVRGTPGDEGARGEAAGGADESGAAASPASRRGELKRVRVQESRKSSTWSKGRIVAALMNEANLPRRVAEEVASRVEQRVLHAELRRITTSLIRELVDNELVSLGLASALRRQGLVGLPRHDLRAVLSGAGPEAGHFADRESSEVRVASEVVRRFALEEVFDEHVCEAHLDGDLELHDVGRLQRLTVTCVPAELLLTGPPSAVAPFEVLEELGGVLRHAASACVLEDSAALLKPLLRSRGGRSEGLASFLRGLRSVAHASGARIDLGRLSQSPGPRSRALTSALLTELAALPADPLGPRLFLDAAELEDLLHEDAPEASDATLDASSDPDSAPGRGTRDLDRLLASGRVVPTWSRADERFAGPGCRRHPRERAAVSCGGAVALNLPRLAWRAGPWREDHFLESLAELVRLALQALESLSVFQERCSGARPGALRGRVGFALAPVGMREALKLLGDGEIRRQQGARILGFLCDAARRLGESRRLAVVVSPFFGARAAARFARLDAELPQHAQRLLFDQGVGAGLDPAAPYGRGFSLAPGFDEDLGRAEASLLSTVPTGALAPFPWSSAPEALGGWRADLGTTSPSTVWRRFVAARSASLDPSAVLGEPSSASAAHPDPTPDLFTPAAAATGTESA